MTPRPRRGYTTSHNHPNNLSTSELSFCARGVLPYLSILLFRAAWKHRQPAQESRGHMATYGNTWQPDCLGSSHQASTGAARRRGSAPGSWHFGHSYRCCTVDDEVLKITLDTNIFGLNDVPPLQSNAKKSSWHPSLAESSTVRAR